MAVVAVALLSVGVGASAMGGIESYASATGGSEGYAKAESSGSMAYKRVSVDKFDEIEIGGLVGVEYQQGKFPGYIELETLSGFLDNFDVESKDGELKLDCHVNTNKSNLKFIVRITAPELREVKMNGVTSFKVNGLFSFKDEFRLETDGVATVSFGEVRGKIMKITNDGVATVHMIAAELQSLDIMSNGVSDMRLKGLNVEHINAIVQSASSIVLGGRCRKISKIENGAGRVDTKGLIVETGSRKHSSAPSSSGQTMPRIP